MKLISFKYWFSHYVENHILPETTCTTDSCKKANSELSVEPLATNSVDSGTRPIASTLTDPFPKASDSIPIFPFCQRCHIYLYRRMFMRHYSFWMEAKNGGRMLSLEQNNAWDLVQLLRSLLLDVIGFTM